MDQHHPVEGLRGQYSLTCRLPWRKPAKAGVSIMPSSLAKVRVDDVAYVPITDAAPNARLALARRRDGRAATPAKFLALATAAL